MSQSHQLTRSVFFSVVTLAAILLGSSPAAHAAGELPPAPEYQPPSVEDVSEETLGQARVADGEGSQVSPGVERFIQIESPNHFLNTPYWIGEELDLWIVPPEGEDGTYFGTFEVPDDDTDGHYFSMLGPVTFPESAFEYSGIYAAVLTDSTGEVLVWQRTLVEIDGDELDHESGPGTQDEWPVPVGVDGEEAPAPELSGLSGDTYGLLAIDEQTPVLPLNRGFTSITDTADLPAQYWLIPPDGSDAINVAAHDESAESGSAVATLSIDPERVPFTGIFALAGVDAQGVVVGWSPFGVSPEGRSIAPGDPGVNTDNTATDRSIFPIPDSVPVPGEAEDDEPSPTPEETTTTEPDESDESGATATPSGEQTSGAPPAASSADDTTGLSTTTIVGLAAAAVVLMAAIALGVVLVRRRSSADAGSSGPGQQPLQR